MKIVPIYIVFEASILLEETEKANDLIQRTIGKFRTNPYDLEMVSLGIMSYQAEVSIIRKLTPIIDYGQININQLFQPFDSLELGRPNFEKMIDALIVEISEISRKESPWGPNVIIIANDYKLSELYKGLSQLHAQCDSVEVCIINNIGGVKSDLFLKVESLDCIENIGYSLVQFYDGDLDNYYHKNKVRLREI
jgi:uncharacterized protein YegL